ncbi:MAG: alanine racemase [Enterocloster sp.]
MDGYNLKRSCWLDISLDNVRDNFFAFKKMVGPDVKVMPAVKANAYGHGIVPCGKGVGGVRCRLPWYGQYQRGH